MAFGRPTKYSDEILEKALDYAENYDSYGDVIPSVVGLCRVINRSKSIVYDWEKHEDKQDFSDILKRISENQEQALLNGGLSNVMNPTITKLVLSKHGYSDAQKIEQETTHKVDASLAERLAGGSKE